ncbi:MAG: site-2 protease family protein [Halobacteriales archaeon]
MADGEPPEPGPDTELPESGPRIEEFASVFRVEAVSREDDRTVYYGERLAPRPRVLDSVRPLFRDRGYDVVLTRQGGRSVLVAEPAASGRDIPWLNIALFVATVVSTLWAGTLWYRIPQPFSPPTRLLGAWPFAAAVMGVLGVHELGHYAMSRYHGVDASLPYFIPLPITIIGTAGAVIRIRDRMPSRKALFDIGVAGPLAGLVATVVVTVIGLTLPPLSVSPPPGDATGPVLLFNNPPLLDLIAAAVGEPTGYADDPTKRVSPVVFGGWVGMFITFLNLLPVGQLDGGHITRSIIGERQRTISALVPAFLFGLAGYLYYFQNLGAEVGVWVFWGVFTLLIARAGSANPISEWPLDARRKWIGALTLFLGALCFTPVPFRIITG